MASAPQGIDFNSLLDTEDVDTIFALEEERLGRTKLGRLERKRLVQKLFFLRGDEVGPKRELNAWGEGGWWANSPVSGPTSSARSQEILAVEKTLI